MILVHHLQNSRSQRVLWLLEELGFPFEVRRYERDPKTLLAPPELRRIHPLGKAPIVEVDGLMLVVPEIGDNYHWMTPDYLATLPPLMNVSTPLRSGAGAVDMDNLAGARLAVGSIWSATMGDATL